MRKMMMSGLMALVLAACVPVLAANASAQDKPEKEAKPTYKVEFSVYEVENGKRLNARKYMTLVDEGEFGRIRVGSQVPFVVGGVGSGGYQYKDIGMNIDCRPHSRENGVSLDLTVEMSSVLKPEASYQSSEHPVFRTDKSSLTAVLPLGKPTIASTMDDVSSDRRYEIEVTATKVR
ncbi:MAG TPA: hypothetical protein VJV74_03385 [Terriglobia bacterium]|nr:hypothetical protein [Terriglobia bacterium]